MELASLLSGITCSVVAECLFQPGAHALCGATRIFRGWLRNLLARRQDVEEVSTRNSAKGHANPR